MAFAMTDFDPDREKLLHFLQVGGGGGGGGGGQYRRRNHHPHQQPSRAGTTRRGKRVVVFETRVRNENDDDAESAPVRADGVVRGECALAGEV